MLKRHAHRKSTLTKVMENAKKKSPKDFYLTYGNPCSFFKRKFEKLADPIKNLKKIKRGAEKNKRNFEVKDKHMKKIKELYMLKTGRDLFSDSGYQEYIENKFYEKFYIIEMMCAILSTITIVLGIFHYEMTYNKNEINHKNLLDSYSSLLYMITFFSIALWANIIFKHLLRIQLAQIKGYIRQTETIWSNKGWIYLFIEIGCFFIHPNILTNKTTYTSKNPIYYSVSERSMNSILTIFLLFRSYYIIRYVIYLADDYMDPKSDKICKTFFFKPNFMFSLKAMFKSQPFFIYGAMSSLSLICFSFCVRVFERELRDYSHMDFDNVWNVWWYITITMLTVGYGDFYVKSTEARVFAMCACITGLFLSSMMIISVSNYLSLNPVERTAFSIFKRVHENEEIDFTAKKIIQKFGEFAVKRKKIKRSKTVTTEVDNEDILLKNIKSLSDELNRKTSSKFLESMSTPLNSSISTLSFLDKEYTGMKQKQISFQNDLAEIKLQLKEICNSIKIGNKF